MEIKLNKPFKGKGEVRGYTFTIIEERSNSYLCRVNSDDTGAIYYEVFEKIINRRWGGVSYPTSKAFGRWAWTIMDLDKAKEKLNEINNRVINRK